jgi:DNA-binding XRE family transcriptional regulator
MDNIKQLRQKVGISRIMLAQAAGISRFRLYESEKGLRTLTPEEIAACERALAAELARFVRTAAELQGRMAVAR